MLFKTFTNEMASLSRESGVSIQVKQANGRYYGNCSDGTFVSNANAKSICFVSPNGSNYMFGVGQRGASRTK